MEEERQNSTTSQPSLDPTVAITSSSLLVAFCVVSLIANVLILTSVRFMRSKIQPTIYITISLAAADTLSLFLFGLALTFFTLLPGLGRSIEAPCVEMLIEVIKMGAIMTALLHLVALAGVHYYGILKPLRYYVNITNRRVKYIALALWTLPSTILIINTFIIEKTPDCSPEFLKRAKFRTTYAIPFFTIMALMLFIYCHMYIIAVNYQKKRHLGNYTTENNVLSRNTSQPTNDQEARLMLGNSSSVYHQRSTALDPPNRTFSRTRSFCLNGHPTGGDLGSPPHDLLARGAHPRARKQYQMNKKAIGTCLMITGSMVCGWAPVFLYFALCCKDCLLKDYWNLKTYKEHALLVAINFLMIAKTATNSYIYVCRVRGQKEALSEMWRWLRNSRQQGVTAEIEFSRRS